MNTLATPLWIEWDKVGPIHRKTVLVDIWLGNEQGAGGIKIGQSGE